MRYQTGKRNLLRNALIGLIGLPVAMSGAVLTVGFEEVSLVGAGVEAYAGGGVYYSGADQSMGFESEGMSFWNEYTDWGGGFFSWNGWAYSTTSDVETAGPGNQFSAYPGVAREGNVYALTYVPSLVNLPVGWRSPASISVTNGTYAGISMRDGDDFAKKFGVGDYFRLTLTGLSAFGAELGSSEVYLADFREGTEPGYILDTWKDVDLSEWGPGVAYIAFSLESTDVGAFGMNTPSFVAVDNIILNETPTWGGFDLTDEGWVDTGDFLGWVHPDGDYVYVLSLESFVYLPESQVRESGAWVYLPE